jgi:RNA polymerase sigma factor (TIGR02999 family)
MSEVTRILSAIEQGEPHAADQLLPLVYEELCKLAGQKLAQEKPGQTLQATALLHEAHLRLVANGDASAPREQPWNSRRHFFGAAAEAMRRILLDRACDQRRLERGGVSYENVELEAPFKAGQEFRFGVTPEGPEKLGFTGGNWPEKRPGSESRRA